MQEGKKERLVIKDDVQLSLLPPLASKKGGERECVVIPESKVEPRRRGVNRGA